jgi:hypothetical protein
VLLDELRINAGGLRQNEEQLQRAINVLRKNQVPWSRIGEAIGQVGRPPGGDSRAKTELGWQFGDGVCDDRFRTTRTAPKL